MLGNAIVGLFAFNFPTFFATLSTLTFEQPSLFGIAESINAVTAILAGLMLARYLRTPTGLTVGVACVALGLTLAWVALGTDADDLPGQHAVLRVRGRRRTARPRNRWCSSTPRARWSGG